jgi:hypothetical protein
MPENSLNLIAVGIFLLTLSAFMSPLLNISPFIPAATTLGILSLLTLDSWAWGSRGLTLLLERLAGEKQRQRILHHEAGHFLVGYLLDIPITGYSLSAWEAWRQGQPGEGGVQFDALVLEKRLKNPQEMPLTLERLCTVWMAGIAAEKILYGEAQGGESDRASLRIALKLAGLSPHLAAQKESWGLLQAKNLLEKHSQLYEELVQALHRRESVEQCQELLARPNLDMMGEVET